MERKGIIEVVDKSTYGEIGSGDPGDPISALQNALPGKEDLNPKAQQQVQNQAPIVPQKGEPTHAQAASASSDTTQGQQDDGQDQQRRVPQLLAELFKSEGIDVGKIDEKASIKDVFAKAKELVIGDPDKLAEKYAKRKGLTDDVVETAKMLSSGKLSFPEQEHYNRLSSYANFKLEIPEDASDGEREAIIANAKRVVEHMYEAKLTGKAKQRAIESIDEYSEDFEDLVSEGVKHAAEEREAFKKGILSKAYQADQEEDSFMDQVRSVISQGDLFGQKADKATIDRQLSLVFDETETIEFSDGTTETVSPYIKNLIGLKKDPLKAARMMVLIAEGLNMDTPIQIGKKQFANELDAQLAGAIISAAESRPGIPNKPLTRRGVEVLETRTY